MAVAKTLLSALLMFIITIYTKCDIVETKEEIQGEEQYVPAPDQDSISNIFNNLV